ncbi:MAG: glutathione peroxidase [Wenzhouxiangella sp.]
MLRRSFIVIGACLGLILAGDIAAAACNNLLDFSHRRLASSQEENLCQAYAGKVVLVVNTASRCGFTGQFSDLEALYQKYRDQGLVVLGFPSDDFNQELAEEEATAEVCYVNYGVTFPMFATTGVRGEGANDLFRALAEVEQAPRWNFTKYLIGRDGTVLDSFGSRVQPLDSELEQAVAAALGGP